MARSGYQILDLEDFAGHRGSVLGSNPDGAPQPAQKLFECRIYHQLAEMDPSKPVWIEGEAKKVHRHCSQLFNLIYNGRNVVPICVFNSFFSRLVSFMFHLHFINTYSTRQLLY
jgi:tRNA 2-selenouridine synthase SelU